MYLLGNFKSGTNISSRNVIIATALLLTHYCAGDKIEKNEMGGACSSDGGGERLVQGFGGETCGKESNGESQV
jgi:hypothetical protein